MQKYHIKLNETEIDAIHHFLSSGQWNVQSKARAKVLLDLHETKGGRTFSVQDIADRNGVSKVTIWHVCKKYNSGGIEAVIHRKNKLPATD